MSRSTFQGENKFISLWIVMAGDPRTGKTSLFQYLTKNGAFSNLHIQTNYSDTRLVDATLLTNLSPSLGRSIFISDTPGGRVALDPRRLSGVRWGLQQDIVFFVIFDLSNRDSFIHVDNYVSTIRKQHPGYPIMLVGTKSELPQAVTQVEIEDKIRSLSLGAYVDISVSKSLMGDDAEKKKIELLIKTSEELVVEKNQATTPDTPLTSSEFESKQQTIYSHVTPGEKIKPSFWQSTKTRLKGFMQNHWKKILFGAVLGLVLVTASVFSFGVVPATLAGGVLSIGVAVGAVSAATAATSSAVGIATGIGVGLSVFASAIIGAGLGCALGMLGEKIIELVKKMTEETPNNETYRTLLSQKESEREETSNYASIGTNAIETKAEEPQARHDIGGGTTAALYPALYPAFYDDELGGGANTYTSCTDNGELGAGANTYTTCRDEDEAARLNDQSTQSAASPLPESKFTGSVPPYLSGLTF